VRIPHAHKCRQIILEPYQPIGKELEILKAIAVEGACSQYSLRRMKGKTWSNRTIQKRVHRLEREGLVTKGVSGYEVTDDGLFQGIRHSKFLSDKKKFVKKARENFPNGRTAKITDNELQYQSSRQWLDLTFQPITELIKTAHSRYIETFERNLRNDHPRSKKPLDIYLRVEGNMIEQLQHERVLQLYAKEAELDKLKREMNR
jgi:hypothetical protein